MLRWTSIIAWVRLHCFWVEVVFWLSMCLSFAIAAKRTADVLRSERFMGVSVFAGTTALLLFLGRRRFRARAKNTESPGDAGVSDGA